MTKKNPSIIVRWTKEGPVTKINSFENLSPVKIEKCFEAVMREWYRLRAVSRGQRHVQEQKERIGAENG